MADSFGMTGITGFQLVLSSRAPARDLMGPTEIKLKSGIKKQGSWPAPVLLQKIPQSSAWTTFF